MTTYKNAVEFVADGVEACWLNAVELVESAKQMKQEGRNGLTVSLCVLALEEIGKIYVIDGLLFAKPGDERSDLYAKGFRSHTTKLRILDLFPIMLEYLWTFDPRYLSEKRFKLTLAIVLDQYKQDRTALAKWLGPNCDLVQLDQWKQKGFYVHAEEHRLVRPTEMDDKLAAALLQLATRIVDAVNFVLKDNVERYRERIRSLRQKLTDVQQAEIKKRAQRIVVTLFSLDESETPPTTRVV